jgi:hypothetical protein
VKKKKFGKRNFAWKSVGMVVQDIRKEKIKRKEMETNIKSKEPPNARGMNPRHTNHLILFYISIFGYLST